MPVYKAPLDDIRFVLNDVLKVETLCTLPGYEDATPDLIDQILTEAAKFCENELLPLNQSGDAEGCVWDNGVVRTPNGFKRAYTLFCEAGWNGISMDPHYGGQGLPKYVNSVLEEMICATNLSFGLYPGLTHGACKALETHGSDALKDLYLPRITSGEWSATMCLTEPQCGTDLGLIRSKAEPQADGSYKITGQKIFISAGEHDLTENIVHLVLAKLPDAPAGVKGISLFLVPKLLPRPDGAPGARNGVSCASIEHKMGLKASATCVMQFDDATGWLVGAPHKGLRAMFTMMNQERLAVGIQGLGVAEVAYQNGAHYAKDRLQGRALAGSKYPDKVADPIIVHPDVRRNLLEVRALTEGSRALAHWVSTSLDIMEKHPDPAERARAEELVALLTPVVKAFLTDLGFEGANKALQVFGGHGYIREYGMEQFVRDARICQIYEGTNGIQALDLVGRKMPANMGRSLRRFFHPVAEALTQDGANPALQEFVAPLAKSFGKLQASTGMLAMRALKDREEAGAAATDYLRQFALVAVGYMWLLMARAAIAKLAAGTGDAVFLKNKLATARFFFSRVLPEADASFKKVMAGKASVMELDDAAF
jgi:alkylation response protein AidB-like acyl-CoA dehydrogenase